ncbi:MAG: hypothetical protein ABSG86_20940 [Thermoguttaceae bacterium]|jgi:hypothetical protein
MTTIRFTADIREDQTIDPPAGQKGAAMPELSRFLRHQQELIADWRRLQDGQAPLPIAPLE